jgi:hypothetical protein
MNRFAIQNIFIKDDQNYNFDYAKILNFLIGNLGSLIVIENLTFKDH